MNKLIRGILLTAIGKLAEKQAYTSVPEKWVRNNYVIAHLMLMASKSFLIPATKMGHSMSAQMEMLMLACF